ITTGAYHSNHARLTAAFARRSGVDVYLVLTKPGSKDLKGNLLLDRLLGAKILHADNPDEADKVMNELAQELEKRGRKPYVISRGGAIPPGVLGYAYAVFELAEQFSELGIKPNYIIHASGTGATQAGLILGSKLAGLDAKIIGISVGRRSPELINRIYRLVEEGAEYAGVKIKFTIDDIIVYDDYTEGGYGVINKRVVDVIRQVSLKEAIFLDPVYTAKAMLGLIDLVEKGVIPRGSNVLFIHTGGTPILFQYDNEIANYFGEE
ncbi:MAG: 1-aminocyclopropane-1-carboxylate deaminase/D-cysteine desulfhydrase, partial [Sulfolobales archaeon]